MFHYHGTQLDIHRLARSSFMTLPQFESKKIFNNVFVNKQHRDPTYNRQIATGATLGLTCLYFSFNFFFSFRNCADIRNFLRMIHSGKEIMWGRVVHLATVMGHRTSCNHDRRRGARARMRGRVYYLIEFMQLWLLSRSFDPAGNVIWIGVILLCLEITWLQGKPAADGFDGN